MYGEFGCTEYWDIINRAYDQFYRTLPQEQIADQYALEYIQKKYSKVLECV
jgi:hypothetical protein